MMHTTALTSSEYTQTICYTGVQAVIHNNLAQLPSSDSHKTILQPVAFWRWFARVN